MAAVVITHVIEYATYCALCLIYFLSQLLCTSTMNPFHDVNHAADILHTRITPVLQLSTEIQQPK